MLQSDAQADARYRALQGQGSAPEAVPALVRALYDDSWRVRKLASELLSRAEATPQLLQSLVGVLGDRDQTGARNAAASALGLLGAEAVPPLVGLLGHADADQRKLAADVLGEVRRQEAVPALLSALQDDDANVQVSAAEALGRIGGAESFRALERLLRASKPLLRVAGLEGLAALGRAPALPAVVPLLEAVETRRSAYRLLGRVGHPAAFSLLLRGFGTSARDAALAGLGARETPPPAELESTIASALRRLDDAHAWLASSLLDDDLSLRRGALFAVAAAGSASLAPHVAEAARGGALSELVLAVLVRLGLPGAWALLESEAPSLADLSPEARAVAAEAVVRAADPVLVPSLARLAEGAEAELAELAARALGRCRTAEALPPLGALLEADARSSLAGRSLVSLGATFPSEVSRLLSAVLARRIRPHALRAFVQIAPRTDALALLAKGARDPAESVRAATAESAVTFESQGMPYVAQGLSDESPLVRRAAARALPRAPRAEASPLVERALLDESPLVLAAAAIAAGELGASAAVPRLGALLSHAEGAVVLAALQALGELGALTTPMVAQGCAHGDPEVVKAALTHAAARPEVGTLAAPLLSHARWDVRVAAARALAAGAGRESLVPLHRALEKETDDLAKELLMAAAATLTER